MYAHKSKGRFSAPRMPSHQPQKDADKSRLARFSALSAVHPAEMDDGYQYRCSYTDIAEDFGRLQAADDTEISHVQGTADANDTFALNGGALSVTTNRAADASYYLEDGSVKIEVTAGEVISAQASFSERTVVRTVSFKYNHSGLRSHKIVTEGTATTTTEYTLHGKLITHLTKSVVNDQGVETSSEKLHFFYDSQSQPAFVEYGGAILRYVHNLQGDIVAIVDEDGNAVVEYKYDAWGKLVGVVVETGIGAINPFRYRGYVYDGETEFCYLRSRYFSPSLGRFLNGDLILTSGILNGNLFQYTENNPICRGDKAGKDSYYLVLNVYDPADWNNGHGHYDLSIISKENPERGVTFSYGPIIEDGEIYSDDNEYPARYTVWLAPDRGKRKPCLRFILYDGLPEDEYENFKTFFFKFFSAIDDIKESTTQCRFKVPWGEYDKYCVSKLSYCGSGLGYLVDFIVIGRRKLSTTVSNVLDMFKNSQCDVTDDFKSMLSGMLDLYNP